MGIVHHGQEAFWQDEQLRPSELLLTHSEQGISFWELSMHGHTRPRLLVSISFDLRATMRGPEGSIGL
jgi:hypothetical protein